MHFLDGKGKAVVEPVDCNKIGHCYLFVVAPAAFCLVSGRQTDRGSIFSLFFCQRASLPRTLHYYHTNLGYLWEVEHSV